MYRTSAPGQWASICQSSSAIRLQEKMTREICSFRQYALRAGRFLGATCLGKKARPFGGHLVASGWTPGSDLAHHQRAGLVHREWYPVQSEATRVNVGPNPADTIKDGPQTGWPRRS